MTTRPEFPSPSSQPPNQQWLDRARTRIQQVLAQSEPPNPCPQRRRGDAHGSPVLLTVPTTTLHHGSNARCPDVQSGQADRCPGHHVLGNERPVEHLRNALQLVHVLMDVGELMLRTPEAPAVIVPFTDLDAIGRRIEAAMGVLEREGVRPPNESVGFNPDDTTGKAR